MSDTKPGAVVPEATTATATVPRRITGQAPRIHIEGENGTNLLLKINETARATESILKKLDESVLPQLGNLWGDMRKERELASQFREEMRARLGAVEKRQDTIDARDIATNRRRVRPIFVFIGTVLAFALGGAIARTYDALVLSRLGASDHARPDHHVPVPDLER